MRHRSVRVWWKPWVRRCACGCDWYPCPDSVKVDRPGPDPQVLRRNLAHWDAPTARHPTVRNERPLMTRGQQWRSRPSRTE